MLLFKLSKSPKSAPSKFHSLMEKQIPPMEWPVTNANRLCPLFAGPPRFSRNIPWNRLVLSRPLFFLQQLTGNGTTASTPTTTEWKLFQIFSIAIRSRGITLKSGEIPFATPRWKSCNEQRELQFGDWNFLWNSMWLSRNLEITLVLKILPSLIFIWYLI